ncbi:hypothetical protein L202_00808 [Cryptococcus amylolentus CBS 6039]|uniref:Uncharacterized protein n=2 Tax=Cryptococcus amylolentus TaxID=104669 RepID=A0A1E3I8P6_9TREE|nr:hypothetical protein L202_00808 [Cryptococcus amylolentus CBS 6039]ODN84964.1 hypothetical protein L202_00808 [Cryptococcus amylolentus CBS 6039]ODO11338.1 hypothetical protein I350_00117 [Cryptococcus amylolentus CBS 6273]
MSYDAALPQISSSSTTRFVPPRIPPTDHRQQSWDPAESSQSWGGYDWCDPQQPHLEPQLSNLPAFNPPPPPVSSAQTYQYPGMLQPTATMANTAFQDTGSFYGTPYPIQNVDRHQPIPSLVDSRSSSGSSVSLPNMPRYPQAIITYPHAPPDGTSLISPSPIPLLNLNATLPYLIHKTPPVIPSPLPPAPVLFDTVPHLQRPVPPRDGQDGYAVGMPEGTFSVGGGGEGMWRGMMPESGMGMVSPVEDRRFSAGSQAQVPTPSSDPIQHFGGIYFTDPFPPSSAPAPAPLFSSAPGPAPAPAPSTQIVSNPSPISPSSFLPPPPKHSYRPRDYTPPTPPPGKLSTPRPRPLPTPFRTFKSYQEMLHDRIDEYGARAMSMPLTHRLMLETERKKRLGLVVAVGGGMREDEGARLLRTCLEKEEAWDKNEEERLLRKEGLLSPFHVAEEDEDEDEVMPLLTTEAMSSPREDDDLDDSFNGRPSGGGRRARRAKRVKKAVNAAARRVKKFLCTECNEGFTRKNDMDLKSSPGLAPHAPADSWVYPTLLPFRFYRQEQS